MTSLLAAGLAIFAMAQTPPGASPPDRPLVHPLFTDHAVLQRDVPLPIWGYAAPGSKVEVKFVGQTVSTTAEPSGRWQVKVGPFPSGGPHALSVSNEGRSAEVADLLMGDVWICSGQSNMEWPTVESVNGKTEVANADHPRIRLFTVPHVARTTPQATVDASWEVCSPGTVANFSAVGYFFGREIEKEVGVPVGLIDSSWGGTIAEAWMSESAIEAIPDFADALASVKDARGGGASQSSKRLEKMLAAWWKKNDPGTSADTPWSDAILDDREWKTMDLPGNWENKGLPDFDGIAWFRREVTLPESWAGKDLTIKLGRVDDRDTTFFNGVAVGQMDEWLDMREYTIPGKLVKAGRNLIAVRVFDKEGLGGFGGSKEDMKLIATGVEGDEGRPVDLAGDWRYKLSSPSSSVASPPDVETKGPNRVTVLYDGMIAPLVPFAIKGATWYQGEANAGRPDQYRRVLPALIDDWREKFGVGEFPFLIVQLANYQKRLDRPKDSKWAELREAQFLTTRAVPNAAVALAIDIGEANDIHPKNKQEVGHRLALDALAMTYGKQVESSGPVFRSAEFHANSARLTFDHAASGLVSKGTDKLEGFAIAGEDGKFVWADAVIDGNGVVVSSTEIDHPKFIRYAWADNPACNLYNGAGLPAVPFRTDAPEPGN